MLHGIVSSQPRTEQTSRELKNRALTFIFYTQNSWSENVTDICVLRVVYTKRCRCMYTKSRFSYFEIKKFGRD